MRGFKIFASTAVSISISLTGCTDAQTVLESLSLKYPSLKIRQGGIESTFLVVNNSTSRLKFDFPCPFQHDLLQISYTDGATWENLATLDPSKSECSINQIISIPTSASWPLVNVLLRTKGEDATETRPVAVKIIKPEFLTTSVSIEENSAVTNLSAYTVKVNATLGSSGIENLLPTQVYLTNIPGCGSGGEWVPYKESAFARTIVTENTTNYTFAKFRDAGDNDSLCVSDGILHDNVKPVADRIEINGGAARAINVAATLTIVAAGDAKEMQISNTTDCNSDNPWHPYATTKSWTLPGPGINSISVRFRDEAGNVSDCKTDTIDFNTTPPPVPSSISVAAGIGSTDNEDPVSVVVAPVRAGDFAKIYMDSTCTTLLGEALGEDSVNQTATVIVDIPNNRDGMSTRLWSKSVSPEGLSSACSAVYLDYTLDATPPRVMSVSTTNNNGNYTTGQSVLIDVTFSEKVVVTGTGLGIFMSINGTSVFAPYSSGSGTTKLRFIYTILAPHVSARIDYAGASAIELSGASITDEFGNFANKALPVTNGQGQLFTNHNISINYTLSIARAPGVNPTDSKDPVDIVVYGVLKDYKAHIFTDANCTFAAVSSTENPKASSGGGSVTIPIILSTDGPRTFYFKVIDPGGTAGNCSTTFASYTLDKTFPSVTSVTSSAASGNYSTGQTIPIQVKFSKAVTVVGSDLRLNLNLNGTTVPAVYTSGSGTDTLNFNYNIMDGHFSALLDYTSIDALSLQTSSVVDSNNNNASVKLPAPGGNGSLSKSKSISVNYNISLSLAGGTNPIDNKNPVNIVVSGVSTDYTARIYSDSSCNTLLGQAISNGGTTATVPATLNSDGNYTFYTRIFDLNNSGTTCSTSSVTYRLDRTGPSILRVTSTTADGNYTSGSTIDISVVFNESVSVVGSGLSLNLNLNGTPVSAPYSAGNGSTTLRFTYTPLESHLTADLDTHGTTAFQMGTASLRDAVGNAASLTLPAPGATNSLSNLKQISVNYDPVLSLPPNVASRDNKKSFNLSASKIPSGYTVKVYSNSVCSALVGEGFSTGNSASALTNLTADGVYNFYFRVFDPSQVGDTCRVSSVSYTLDSTGPRVLSVTSTSTDQNYTSGSIDISVNFNENVTVTGSGVSINLDLNGQTVAAPYSSGSGTTTLRFTYSVLASHLSNDLDYTSSSALQVGSAVLSDNLGNTATLTLPAKGAPDSLSANKNLQVNHSIGLALDPSVSATDSQKNVPIIVSGVMKNARAQVYKNNMCTGTPTEVTSSNSDGKVVVNLNLSTDPDGAYQFYGRVVDSSGSVMLPCSGPVSYTLDTSGPVISSVTSTSGNYTTGQVVNITVNWNKPVTVTGTGVTLGLLLNGTTVHANYQSGSGTQSLIFAYTVLASHLTDSLEYAGPDALKLATGTTIKDTANGKDGIRSLPTPGTPQSLSGQTDITVNYSIGLALAAGFRPRDNKRDIQIIVSGVMKDFIARLYSDSTCSNQVGMGTGDTSGQAPINLSLDQDGSYTYFARVESMSGINTSCSATSASYTLDTVGPAVLNVTSSSTNGDYVTGQTVDIAVTFQEPVTVVGSDLSVTVELLNNITAKALYSFGSGTNELHFTYNVLRSHASADLSLASNTGLIVGESTSIRDAIDNDALTALPSEGSTTSLSALKQITINRNVTIHRIIPPPFRAYFPGEYIEFVVQWSGPVLVTGTPTLALKSGAKNPILNYQPSTGSSTSAVLEADSRFVGTVNTSSYDNGSVEVVSLNVGSGATIKNSITSPAAASADADFNNIPAASKIFADVKTRTGSLPSYSLLDPALSFFENSAQPVFTISSTAATSENVSISLRTIPIGGGIGAGDFNFSSLTATLASTSKSSSVSFTLTNNSQKGLVKTFAVQATDASLGAVLGNRSSKVVAIRDDESNETVTMIATGNAHACVLYNTGRVQCFGANHRGQLGNGSTSLVSNQVSQPMSSGVTKIYAAGNSTCALLDTKKLSCWGENTHGVLGIGNQTDQYRPTPVSGFTDSEPIEMVAMSQHTICALYVNGNQAVKCWGQNNNGQAGSTDINNPVLTPRFLREWNTTSQLYISVSSTHSCLYNTGSKNLFCWGLNRFGAFGNANLSEVPRFTHINSVAASSGSSLTAFSQILTTHHTTCGLRPTSTDPKLYNVFCWGSDQNGRLGNGAPETATTSIPTTPVSFSGSSLVVKSLFTSNHALASSSAASSPICGLTTGGSVVCWGYGGNGDMYTGSASVTNVSPVATLMTGLSQVSLGESIACGVDETGTVLCATLEPYTTNTTALPMRKWINPDDHWLTPKLLNVETPTNVSATSGGVNCYSAASGSVFCNSTNIHFNQGFPGNGTSAPSYAPTRLHVVDQKAVTTSGFNGCSLGNDQVLRCWGSSNNGQVGDGLNVDRTIPIFVMANILKVKTGGDTALYGSATTTCALKESSALACWGRNALGQLGDGTTLASVRPKEVIASGVTDFAVAGNFICAIVNGVIRCAGANDVGGLGDASGQSSLVFVDTLDAYGGKPLQIEAGDSHMCARFDDNSLRCWGLNTSGQIGRGNATGSMIFPYKVPNLSVKDFSLGANHTCAINLGNELRCWGLNNMGQIGNNSYTPATSPTLVSGLTNVTKVWSGRDNSTCAVANNQFYCWGLSSGLFTYRPAQGFMIPVPGLQY